MTAHDSRVTDGARTRDSRSHNPTSTTSYQDVDSNLPATDDRRNPLSSVGNRTGGGNAEAFVSPSRRKGGARPAGFPKIDSRVRYAGQTYTVRAVNDTMRVARIWRLPSKGGGLELLASYDVLEPVRRRDYMDREEVRMECTSCGAAHTENARADAIMAHVIRRATCLFCGTKTMRRARGA